MFLVNSRGHHFIATLFRLARRGFTYQGHTFSRSYGVILPSSFTKGLSSALGFSPHPPVSVWGTVTFYLKLRGFSWKQGINHFSPVGPRHHASTFNSRPDFPKQPAYTLKPGQPSPGWSNLLRLPIAIKSGTGILTCFPSTTHFCLALGADSPCAD